jgi:hypothetical protein
LYRLTKFEHALLLFYRAQRLFPQSAEFRLGAEKSLQTITTLLFKPDLFDEVDQLLLTHHVEEQERPKSAIVPHCALSNRYCRYTTHDTHKRF